MSNETQNSESSQSPRKVLIHHMEFHPKVLQEGSLELLKDRICTPYNLSTPSGKIKCSLGNARVVYFQIDKCKPVMSICLPAYNAEMETFWDIAANACREIIDTLTSQRLILDFDEDRYLIFKTECEAAESPLDELRKRLSVDSQEDDIGDVYDHDLAGVYYSEGDE